MSGRCNALVYLVIAGSMARAGEEEMLALSGLGERGGICCTLWIVHICAEEEGWAHGDDLKEDWRRVMRLGRRVDELNDETQRTKKPRSYCGDL